MLVREHPVYGHARATFGEKKRKEKKLGFLEADYASDYESLPVRESALTRFSSPVRGII